MPRLRKGSNVQPWVPADPLIVNVEHQGLVVSVLCGDGTQDLAWLVKQAEIQFSLTAETRAASLGTPLIPNT
jgi:hypothetical protein